MNKKPVIAIDGYSSCGKSTFAKAIAKQMGYLYIDSGAMYRAVALYGIRNKLVDGKTVQQAQLINQLDNIQIDFRKNMEGRYATFLNGENVEDEIRGVEISEHASNVSKIKEVRAKLVALQQAMGKNGGIVMDGRDIGTVVFPHAEIKIFMTASPEIRAQRRYDELKARGMEADYQEVLKNLQLRDLQDSTRTESPLKKADGAVVLDNSHMSPDDQMKWFRKQYSK
ncbi:MAG: (d)CMP kinase [Bacteroidales bacterium]|nr:(d)CMP kinase [Bacteroidales bacterium]